MTWQRDGPPKRARPPEIGRGASESRSLVGLAVASSNFLVGKPKPDDKPPIPTTDPVQGP
jgi:hypothetical protein